MPSDRRILSSTILAEVLLLLLTLAAIIPAWAGTVNPVPFMDQPIEPATVAPGSSHFNLTVHGANFVQGAVIHWNGSPRPTTFVSSRQLRAAIGNQDVATPGSAAVTVVNPGPGGGVSNV